MTRLQIVTHSGKEFFTEVKDYDPFSLNEQINNQELITVLIGDQIISRIDVKNVSPIVEETVEKPIN